MFGGAPPPPSVTEVRRQEAMAKGTIQFTAATCFLLYLSPFVVEYVQKLF